MADDAGPGHNQPPDDLLLRAQALVTNTNRWLKERPKLKTEEEAGLCDDFLTQLRQNHEDVKAAKQAEAEPFELGLLVIRAKYRDTIDLLELAIRRLRAIGGDYLRAKKNALGKEDAARQERARQALADAERLSREAMKEGAPLEATLAAKRAHEAAEKAEKAAKKTVKAQVRGDYSKRAMFLTERWHAEVIDDAKALAHYADHPEVKLAALAAITKVASALARELKDESAAPPGIKFVREETAS